MSKELAGLIKWSGRPEWSDLVDDVLDDHFGIALEDYSLEFETLEEAIGEREMTNLWACAFEDLLTRARGEDDETTIVDDYLKRRGWKEPVSTRRYMEALRDSIMSLYEVGDVAPGQSMWLTDMIGGGEPVQVFEQSATRMLKPGFKLCCRVVEVNGRNRISGGLTTLGDETAAKLAADLKRGIGEFLLNMREERADEEPALPRAMAEAAALILQIQAAPDFTAARLDELLAGKLPKTPPPRFNGDGEELEYHTIFYPYTTGALPEKIVGQLSGRPELRPETELLFNWVDTDANGAYTTASGTKYQERRGDRLHHELEDGTEVLAAILLGSDGLVLATNSKRRADRAKLMLKSLLKGLVGQPRTEVSSYEEMSGRD